MANTQGSLPLLFRAGLRKDFRDSWVEWKENYSQFLKTDTMDGPEEFGTILTGPSRMLPLGDMAAVDYDELVESNKFGGVDNEFGRGFAVSQRTVEDDKYGKAKSGAKWLAHAARMTMEYQGASFLDDAFTGALYPSYDATPWIANTHTFVNASGTWSNIAATPVGLSVSGVTALMDLAQNQKDHNGDPVVMDPGKLIIGNAAGQVNIALQLFKSMSEPFTTENQDNALRIRWANTQVIPSIYCISKTNYFFIDEKYNDANFKVRRAISIRDWQDDETRAYKFAGTMRFMIYGGDPRGWFGSNPT